MNIVKGRNILFEKKGILVHCANAQGVMGAGIALQIRRMYPVVYSDYVEHLKKFNGVNKADAMGSVCYSKIKDDFYILSAIGQLNYGRSINDSGAIRTYVDYNSLAIIFSEVNEFALKTGLDVIFPKIGAGLAGGDWSVISQIIQSKLNPSVNSTLFLL